MARVSFTVSDADAAAITKIVDKAAKLARQRQLPFDRLNASMSLTACHANGCPLRLTTLLYSSDVTFAHDVWGILRHIDTKTGGLRDCFLPRMAVKHG